MGTGDLALGDQVFSQPVRPENDTITLELCDEGGAVVASVQNFREYTFQSHFLTPTDHFSFVIGDEALSKSILDGIYVGQRVQLRVSGYVQAGGYIDKVKPKSSRKGGTEVHIEGRDWLSPAVDANIDPSRVRFQSSMSLLDVIVACFAPYGFGDIGQIVASDEANGNIITGQKRGLKTTKKGRSIKSVLAHQLKPYPHEGVFAFASRLSQRFGLWIWASADGTQLIVDEPDFTQKPIYDLYNRTGVNGDTTGMNNILDSELDADASNQPSVIVATASGGGGEFGRAGMKVIAINELTGIDAFSGLPRAEVKQVIADNPDAEVLSLGSIVAGPRMDKARFRAVYLHDDESKTPDELKSFALREMALRQQHGITYRTTTEGHTIRGVPIYTNSISFVQDDVCRLHAPMWCISRTFHLSRTGGTTTQADWILPGTLDFGD